MGIKETPTNFRTYYKLFKEEYTKRRNEALLSLEELNDKVIKLNDKVREDFIANNSKYSINVFDLEEFNFNRYVNGAFEKVVEELLLVNKEKEFKDISHLYDLCQLAKTQKAIFELNKDIKLYDKLVNISLKEYNNILKLYFYKVHELMITKGYGYVFGQGIGWVCINRCKLERPRPHLDYKATKLKKKQLQEEGKRIYNKEDEAWCQEHGIPYVAEDVRVFKTNKYCYEIPMFGCKLTDGSKFKFEPADFIGAEYRGKTYEEILKKHNNDKYEICNADLGLKTKLTLCLETDSLLYNKFIRNENQKPSTFREANRKNR